MARAVGRLDWWNVYGEHTPYQWQVQRAAAVVDPWGDERADQRAALHALAVIQSQLTKPMDEVSRKSVLSMITEYTQAARKSSLDSALTPEAVDVALPG